MPIRLALGVSLLALIITAPAWAQETGGRLEGLVVNMSGEPLAGQRVELRRLSDRRALRVVILTDSGGVFRYEGLSTGQYIVELMDGGRRIAESDIVELSSTTMHVTGITIARPTAPVRTGRGVVFWTAVGAGIGGALGVAVITRHDCGQPENLCGIAPIMGASVGGLMGLLFGVGR